MIFNGRMMGRIRDSFDFGWKFFQGDATGAQQPNFVDATWRDVDLPHDWSIEGTYSEERGASRRRATLPWDRLVPKHFNVPNLTKTGKSSSSSRASISQ